LKLLCSWSGGKDSCFALMNAVKAGHAPTVLLNMLNEQGKISRSHGIPTQVLAAQAAAMGLPIHMIESSWNDYENNFISALQLLRKQYQVEGAVFGDIDLQAHRDWEEKVCAAADIEALLPLWQMRRKQLVIEMLAAGIACMIVSCNEALGEAFLGKKMTLELMGALESKGVDVCGENGEFHTLVTDCHLFLHPINVEISAKLKHGNYWFTDLRMM